MKKILLLVLYLCLTSCQDNYLNLMTYNIRVGKGLDNGNHLQEIAKFIDSCDVDVVALQEVDSVTERSGKIFQAEYLARAIGMNFVFAGNIKFDGGSYGIATLSKKEISSTKHFLLPNFPGEEQRGLLQTVINFNNKIISVFNTHLDYHENDSLRFLQTTAVDSLVSLSENPVILMGDFNDVPASRSMDLLFEKFYASFQKEMFSPTFPSDNPVKKIDYILFDNKMSFKIPDKKVIKNTMSDHRPVWISVQLN